MNDPLRELPIVKSFYQGKVRDLYDLGDRLLIVSTDRLSAFDVVFPDPIPDKGKILNLLSAFFFRKTKDLLPNHFISDDVDEFPKEFHPFRESLAFRSMLVRKTRLIPFELIARGYITGSAWKEYQKSGTVNGEKMPEDMQESQAFPEPLFTPSTKAERGHDENISIATMQERIDPCIADFLQEKTLTLYKLGRDFLRKCGILLADTKVEFGTIQGEVILIDELLTPDSSRFWDAETWKPGSTPQSFDKQFVRDYSAGTGWNRKPPAPHLPEDVVQKTRDRYLAAYKKITGENKLPWE